MAAEDLLIIIIKIMYHTCNNLVQTLVLPLAHTFSNVLL